MSEASALIERWKRVASFCPDELLKDTIAFLSRAPAHVKVSEMQAKKAGLLAEQIERTAKVFEVSAASPGVRDCAQPIEMATVTLYAYQMRELRDLLAALAAPLRMTGG